MDSSLIGYFLAWLLPFCTVELAMMTISFFYAVGLIYYMWRTRRRKQNESGA